MIVKSTFRQAGGLGAHLLRNDTNELVEIRKDLFRSAPLDLNLALRLMEGISRSNARAKRAFIHVVISPAHPMDNEAAITALSMIEQEFGIAPDAARLVVQHHKGRHRPSHFHAVYSIVDLTTGQAIKSNDNYSKDELVSRRLELVLGEPIIPGPRLAQNIEVLQRRGSGREAALLEPHVTSVDRDPLSRRDIRQAERLDVDLAGNSKQIFDLFEAADRNLGSFQRLVADRGYALSRGDKCILVSQDRTGFSTALGRLLRREGKTAGRVVEIREQDLADAYPNLKPHKDERDDGLGRARTKAASGIEMQWRRGIDEALIDSDMDAVLEFRDRQKRQQDERDRIDREHRNETLKARRAEIAELFWLQDEVRRLRVDRAFRIARILDTPTTRRLAFSLAVAGFLMTGAGLTAALVAGGLSQLALPSVDRARKRALEARTERDKARHERDRALREARAKSREPGARARRAARFSFDQIDKADRILAGFYADALLGNIASIDRKTLNGAEAALGAGNIAGIKSMLERGSPLQIRRLLHWHRGIPEPGRNLAVNAALHRHTRKPAGRVERGSVKAKSARHRPREIEM